MLWMSPGVGSMKMLEFSQVNIFSANGTAVYDQLAFLSAQIPEGCETPRSLVGHLPARGKQRYK